MIFRQFELAMDFPTLVAVETCQGRNFGITAGEGGGGELVLSDKKGVAEVVPNGRTFQSLIILIFLSQNYWSAGAGGGVKKFSDTIFH